MANLPIIGNLISPKAPTPVAVPTVVSPDSSDPAAKAKAAKAEEDAASAQRKLGGSASDILTGNAPDLGGGLGRTKTASNTLLGS